MNIPSDRLINTAVTMKYQDISICHHVLISPDVWHHKDPKINRGIIMDAKQMIGARIKDIRNRKGFTQEELAEKININPKYLSSIERGKENPTLNTLIKLSESLDVNLNDIFHQIEIEDPAKRKALLISLLDEANDDQLKLAYRILLTIIR
jgi:transcriptional regulator with XRE-family HTH domain